MPIIGASGAIAGILGAYIVFFPRSKMRVIPGPFAPPRKVHAVVYIFMWFIIQSFGGVTSLGAPAEETNGVAYWMHIGGFISGIALAFIHKHAQRHSK
jgi:membrane associated rhomboid family serine protease